MEPSLPASVHARLIPLASIVASLPSASLMNAVLFGPLERSPPLDFGAACSTAPGFAFVPFEDDSGLPVAFGPAAAPPLGARFLVIFMRDRVLLIRLSLRVPSFPVAFHAWLMAVRSASLLPGR